jgi:hypothetical protein
MLNATVSRSNQCKPRREPMSKTWVEQQVSSDEGMRIFQQEQLILEVTAMIERLMEDKAITRAVMAEKLGKSRGHVSQLLDGGANMTLRTVSDMFFALGRALVVTDRPIGLPTPTRPKDVMFRVDDGGLVTVNPPVLVASGALSSSKGGIAA